ncbi:hypothetical protein [Paenibacillus tyrfis]|uniref:hypothetical protein n=1 Tax=Paenibacillus tyrfis TaxID=1501230 RepID=UPI0020A168B9|nr:hypothetical protein [Paenibacillus tyrfis]MCP1308488.1 hypothetical protein [Paenibacillus tyrfis]
MLKRIKMVIEQGENEFELVDAYLTPDGSHAFYIHEGTIHYTIAVRTQNERVYVESQVSMHLGETTRGEVSIYDLHDKLIGMSAYQLLNFHVIHHMDDLKLINEN